jgi:undecaprenyl pyrophosphate phosphatase UppP
MIELLTADIVVQFSLLVAIFVTSAIVGYLCIHLLITWLRQRNLYPFAIYCATFGFLFLLLSR